MAQLLFSMETKIFVYLASVAFWLDGFGVFFFFPFFFVIVLFGFLGFVVVVVVVWFVVFFFLSKFCLPLLSLWL